MPSFANLFGRELDLTHRYAVFGQPIAHSLSPRIHALFGAQLGIAVDYRAIEAGRDDFAAALAAFARDGGVGANVTLPLKQDALALCRAASDRARRSGSVNTLLRDGDGWRGDSTDGIGFLHDLRERHGFDPRQRRVLLIGAGGAARAVAAALVDAGVHDLVVANRTRERIADLVRRLASDCVFGCELDKIDQLHDRYDLIVNATSLGHGDDAFELPRRLLGRDTLCYDLSYDRAARPFLDWAAAAGASRACDGLGMLVEQAAESFSLWFGQRPDARAVLAALRAA